MSPWSRAFGQLTALRPAQETLRRYSVVPVVARHLTADDQVGGYDIPAGSTVIAHIEAVHNDGWKQPVRCDEHSITGCWPQQICRHLD